MKAFFERMIKFNYSNCIYIHSFCIFLVIIELINNGSFNGGFIMLIYLSILGLSLIVIAVSIFFYERRFKSPKRFSNEFIKLLMNSLDSIHLSVLKITDKLLSRNPFISLISLTLFAILGFLSDSKYLSFLFNEKIGTTIFLITANFTFLILSFIALQIFVSPILHIENSLTPHQSKEEILYEELRTRFASHNITKDVRNLKSYITILKHEEPQLLAKFTTLDELTDMVEDTLKKFKNSDTIRTKNPFLIHELFDNFLILNKPDLVREGSDLQIEYQKPEYKDIEIHQIFYEVYQVLNNLIDNARKAIANSERKEIQILTSVINAGFVDFQVSDTGVGIDAKARNRVFDIGYSTTNGDGLGLLFVQTTLKRFGGEIQLLPTALSGFSTTFEVKIPT